MNDFRRMVSGLVFLLIACVILLCRSGYAKLSNTVQAGEPAQCWLQVVKLDPQDYGDHDYVLYFGVFAPGKQACAFKGPGMADFTPGVWFDGHRQWFYKSSSITWQQAQQEACGTWQVALTDADDAVSLYAFTVSEQLETVEFLPVPALLEPERDAGGVIAEHCTFRWDSNGADAEADALWVEAAGDDFFYFTHTLDPAAVVWHPGWLETGDAYCKLSYVVFRPDILSAPSWISGPEMQWGLCITAVISSDYHPFRVSYSLDVTGDDRIDLADLSLFAAHWLESK